MLQEQVELLEVLSQYADDERVIVSRADESDPSTWLVSLDGKAISHLSLFNCTPLYSNVFELIRLAGAKIPYEVYERFVTLREHRQNQWSHLVSGEEWA